MFRFDYSRAGTGRKGRGREIRIMSESTYDARTVSAPAPVLSVSPVVLPTPGRAVDLQVRLSAPVTGPELPVIFLSHGHGFAHNLSSLNGYARLATFCAAPAFAV